MIPDAWRREGSVVAVVGLGKSGVAATRLLAREGVRVYASDASDHPYGGDAPRAPRLPRRGPPGVGRPHPAPIPRGAAAVVSPRVPPAAPPPPARRAGPRP